MRLIKLIGAMLVAVLAATATSTVAFAHEFQFSETGLLTVKSHSPQLFRFPSGEVVCTTLTGHGLISALKFKTLVTTVQYKSCTASFTGGTVTEPINAEYEFNAEGTLSIRKDVKVAITAAGVKCEVLILPQSSLKTITYKNVLSELLLSASVKSILSHGKGALCPYGDDKSGEFTGSVLVGLVGGTIGWT